MTEYDFSPEAFEAYQRKQQGIGKWTQDVSKHEPVNPFAASSDRGTSDFYGKKTKAKSRVYDIGGKASTSSSSTYNGPDRPPTPPRSGSVGYVYGSAPYGGYPTQQQQQQQRQQPGWPTNGGYPSPPIPQYPQQQPPVTFFNKSSGQPYAPTFNHQTQLWEYRGPNQQPSKRKKKTKRRDSVPAGLSLGQVVSPGVGGWAVYPGGGGPQPLQSPGLSSAGSYPYSTMRSAQSMSAMYLPSGHTSPASLQYQLPQTAPVTQTNFQAQQQQAVEQARMQQSSRAASPPVIPVFPAVHMQGYAQQPMISPPPSGITTSYTGYPTARTTPVPTGYFPVASPQPVATVVVESKQKEKDSGTSFFGRLTGRKKR